jgi:hypothetical protein
MRITGYSCSKTSLASTKPGKMGRTIAGRLTASLLGAALLTLAMGTVAYAVPKRIIILRHGEKQVKTEQCTYGSYALCSIGQQRSLALQLNYLGKGAANSLFPRNGKPAAIFAVTLHCLELAGPTALSWGIPIQLYSVTPLDGETNNEELLQLNERTREAAKSILHDPRWNGKTLIVFWEHDHIANTILNNDNATLYTLLNLDKLPNTPNEWNSGNYDYFWIVDYGNASWGSTIPTKLTMKKQVFLPPYDTLPTNDWGFPEGLPETCGCVQ